MLLQIKRQKQTILLKIQFITFATANLKIRTGVGTVMKIHQQQLEFFWSLVTQSSCLIATARYQLKLCSVSVQLSDVVVLGPDPLLCQVSRLWLHMHQEDFCRTRDTEP